MSAPNLRECHPKIVRRRTTVTSAQANPKKGEPGHYKTHLLGVAPQTIKNYLQEFVALKTLLQNLEALRDLGCQEAARLLAVGIRPPANVRMEGEQACTHSHSHTKITCC